MVGLSPDQTRPSNSVSRYLIEHGFEVIPVNPHHDEILDLQSYPDLQSIPGDVNIEIVVIFRQPRHTATVVEDAIARFKQTGQRPVVWTQIGVSSGEAAKLAEENGFDYVPNRCAMVEHSRRHSQ